MRVKELAGADLALWVARAQGHTTAAVESYFGDVPRCYLQAGCWTTGSYAPHEDWSQGGPLIEQYGVGLKCCEDFSWYAYSERFNNTASGNSALITAMRAIVASVYGETLPDDNA